MRIDTLRSDVIIVGALIGAFLVLSLVPLTAGVLGGGRDPVRIVVADIRPTGPNPTAIAGDLQKRSVDTEVLVVLVVPGAQWACAQQAKSSQQTQERNPNQERGQGQRPRQQPVSAPVAQPNDAQAQVPAYCAPVSKFKSSFRFETMDSADVAMTKLFGPGPALAPEGGLSTTMRGDDFATERAYLTATMLSLGASVVTAIVVMWWRTRPKTTRPTADPRTSPGPRGDRPRTGGRSPGSYRTDYNPDYRPEYRPSPPAPTAGPQAADALPNVGRTVVAQTHFGAFGGYVIREGLIMWATLDNPSQRVIPGQVLDVVGTSPDRHSFIVSVKSHQELRR